MTKPSMLEGMLLVNKPSGMTSHDVVQAVRRTLGVRRIGHTGTLDPMAEGLLILLVGPSTKHQRRFQMHEKTYEAILKLGIQTDTGDALGVTTRTTAVPVLDRVRVAAVLASFQGAQLQTPPTYSAVKVKGKPAYWWARQRHPFRLAARPIHLSGLELMDYSGDTITFRVHCSAGTYIRTLAESVAARLGSVGHLTALVRLRIGQWSLEEAKPFSWLTEISPDTLARALLPLGRTVT